MLKLFEQSIEIVAVEGPLEGLGGLLVALLEPHQLVSKRGEVGKVVGREELTLDNGEIDFDLVEPAGGYIVKPFTGETLRAKIAAVSVSGLSMLST